MNLTKRVNAFLLGAAVALCLTAANLAAADQLPVNLVSAGKFAVLAGTTVTNTGLSVVNGDLGVWPGSGVTGFGPGVVVGAIHAADTAAQQAQGFLTSAYNDAAGRTVGVVGVAGDLGGQTLVPGLYKSTSTLAITGDLTLAGKGVYIFQIASGLTVNNGGRVVLTGGAQAGDVFWQVSSSATLGTGTAFKGTILAYTSISIATGGTLDGRALARNGAVTLDTNAVTVVTQSGQIGTYNAGKWRLDANGNGMFDAARGNPDSDPDFYMGFPGATAVLGDWNGDGRTKVGVYSNGYWFLDYDGNGDWDGGVVDKLVAWGWPGATPVVGDWNGSGKTKIGVFSNGVWFLDYNGDYLWDGGVIDKQVGWGWAGVTPVVGDWNGDGKTKIGVYYAGYWFLDYNGDYVWDGGVVDKQVGWGWAGVTPIVGDWNGDGKTKIGVYDGGYWYIDYDGNYLWEYPAKDKIWVLGWTGTTPIMGDWSGDGKTKAGAFINGYWYLDYNGNGVFDGAGTDRIYLFGASGDSPIVGRW